MHEDTGPPRQIWSITGEVFAPAGRRRHPLVLVRRCPSCRHAHAHRDIGERQGSCGARYVVVTA